jgi:nucleoid-associated protein YgaU
MSKDVIIAGAIAVGCIALIAVAFIAPKSKPSETEVAKTETTTVTDQTGFGPLPTTTTGIGLEPNSALPPGPVANNFSNNLPGSGTSAFIAPPFPNTSTGIPLANLPPTPVAPPVETPAAPKVAETKTHIVAKDELLGDIALKYLGSSKAWKKIVEANPGLDPKNLKVGQKLVIPAVPDKPADTPVATTGGERTYTVKAGDTLYLIAKKELGSASRWKELEKLNGISSNDLRIGKVIKLPAAAGTATPTDANGTATPAATGGKVHIVAKGETLADISAKYLKSSKNWKKLVEANPGISPENLKIGQKIIIPETGTATEAPAGTAPGTTPEASPTAGEVTEYTVKAGDTLGTIALHALGSKHRWKEIQEANPGLDSKHLRAGQKIKLPGKKSDGATQAPSPAPTTPAAKTPATPTPTPFGGNNSSNLGSPTPNPAPTAFPTDPNFNSPYSGSGFGQPGQSLNQAPQPFGQTGTPGTAPVPAPGLPNTDPFPSVPPATGGPQPLR